MGEMTHQERARLALDNWREWKKDAEEELNQEYGFNPEEAPLNNRILSLACALEDVIESA